MVDFAIIKDVYFDPIYPIISVIALAAAAFGAYITRKMYYATMGASSFWMFLSGFMGSMTVYTTANFLRKTALASISTPLKSVQDVALIVAYVFALMSAIFVYKMFEELTED